MSEVDEVKKQQALLLAMKYSDNAALEPGKACWATCDHRAYLVSKDQAGSLKIFSDGKLGVLGAPLIRTSAS